MNRVRSFALAIALVAGLVTTAFTGRGSSTAQASTRRCPDRQRSSVDSTRAARPVTKDYRSIESAARAAGVIMTSRRQVVAVMVYPTFVDTRVAAVTDACHIVAALANTKGATTKVGERPAFVWTPPLPATLATGFGERFVTSSPGSITVELRNGPYGKWRRYVATSSAMRWTSGS